MVNNKVLSQLLLENVVGIIFRKCVLFPNEDETMSVSLDIKYVVLK